MIDLDEGIVLELPLTPVSKKNRTKIKTGRGGKPYPAKGDDVKAQEAEIKYLVRSLLNRLALPKPLFGPNDALRAEMLWHPRLETTTVRVRRVCRLRERPDRDAANLPAIVLDALQKELYPDDCQVVELEVITDLAS